MGTETTPGNGDDRSRPIRATTEQRERVVRELSEATARGQLEIGEFDKRSAQAWKARSATELADLLDDILPDPMGLVTGAALPRTDVPVTRFSDHVAPVVSGPGSARVTGEAGARWTVAVFSGAEKKSGWTCAASHNAVFVFGGGLIDLREATFEARETVITVYVAFGGAQILVPEDVRVEEHGIGIFGGFGGNTSKKVRKHNRDLPADAPVVRVRGAAVFGGAEVKRVPVRPRRS